MQTERKGVRLMSMTGFGQGTAERDGARVQVELKGVNHRFLDVKMKLPAEVGLLEPSLRAEVQKRVTRARLDIAVTTVTSRRAPPRVVIDENLLAEYLKAVASVKQGFALEGTIGLDTILTMPGVVTVESGAVSGEGIAKELLMEALQTALDAYDAMRAAEGERLAVDLGARLLAIRDAARRIGEEARRIPEAYGRRIRERISVLLESGKPLEESRLAQEVAYLASRADITEELVRLQGYLTQAEETIARPPGPIGKTLDFIMQEMNREANTMSAKAEALPICREALLIKAEVEKIREQVQNIE